MNNPGDCQASPDDLKIVQMVVDYFPVEKPFLNFGTPFQLLIAVILSAQCTDEQVNKVTPVLFRVFPDAPTLAQAQDAVVERIIYPTGFYRAKAAHILGTARILTEKYGGQVPLEMESLLTLPGVGRKTANVIRGQIGGLAALIVDTHFKRVVRRLGLTEEQEPEKIEKSLARWVPQALQYPFSMGANRLGRDLCGARDPDCPSCPLRRLCPSS